MELFNLTNHCSVIAFKDEKCGLINGTKNVNSNETAYDMFQGSIAAVFSHEE